PLRPRARRRRACLVGVGARWLRCEDPVERGGHRSFGVWTHGSVRGFWDFAEFGADPVRAETASAGLHLVLAIALAGHHERRFQVRQALGFRHARRADADQTRILVWILASERYGACRSLRVAHHQDIIDRWLVTECDEGAFDAFVEGGEIVGPFRPGALAADDVGLRRHDPPVPGCAELK